MTSENLMINDGSTVLNVFISQDLNIIFEESDEERIDPFFISLSKQDWEVLKKFVDKQLSFITP